MGRIVALAIGALLVLFALIGQSHALMKAGPGVVGRGLNVVLGPAATSPLDSFTQPTGAYSFRKLRSAYTGPALRIRRASDNAEIDVGFLGFTGFTGAPWDEAAAAAHCAATSCSVRTWYGQAGPDLGQATAANQPQLVFNCRGSLPCIRTTAATQVLQSTTTPAPATGVVSISVVASRAVGTTGTCGWFRQNGATGNRLLANVANRWAIAGGTSGSLATTVVATDAAWHTAVGIINAATSGVWIDGAAVGTGTVTGSTTAGAVSFQGVAATTCDVGEIVAFDAAVLSAGEIAFLNTNQRSFWGF